MRVYVEVEKANKEIQNILNVGLIPIINLSFHNGYNYYGVGYHKELNLICGDIR